MEKKLLGRSVNWNAAYELWSCDCPPPGFKIHFFNVWLLTLAWGALLQLTGVRSCHQSATLFTDLCNLLLSPVVLYILLSPLHQKYNLKPYYANRKPYISSVLKPCPVLWSHDTMFVKNRCRVFCSSNYLSNFKDALMCTPVSYCSWSRWGCFKCMYRLRQVHLCLSAVLWIWSYRGLAPVWKGYCCWHWLTESSRG